MRKSLMFLVLVLVLVLVCFVSISCAHSENGEMLHIESIDHLPEDAQTYDITIGGPSHKRAETVIVLYNPSSDYHALGEKMLLRLQFYKCAHNNNDDDAYWYSTPVYPTNTIGTIKDDYVEYEFGFESFKILILHGGEISTHGKLVVQYGHFDGNTYSTPQLNNGTTFNVRPARVTVRNLYIQASD